jgi:hypothetical protein
MGASNRAALVAFYTEKDPEKVGNVDQMLERFTIPELGLTKEVRRGSDSLRGCDLAEPG